ncbi:MAG: D-aminoacyl-tRNA deacylase [Mariniblastus sp.]
MRAVIQRVTRASVVVDDAITGEIGVGLLVLLGVEDGDTDGDLDYAFNKTIGLRVFEDDQEKMNLSLADVGGELLVVSQFTLLGDVRKGRRPGFNNAAKPEIANQFYERFVDLGRKAGINVQTGVFQADMAVELVNDGPVTILVDSRRKF